MNVQNLFKRWTLASLLALVFIASALPSGAIMAHDAEPAEQSIAVAEQVANVAIDSQAIAEQASSTTPDSHAQQDAQVDAQQDTLAPQQTSTAPGHEPLKRSKRAVETVIDVVSLAHSTYEYNKNPSTMNAVFLAWDAVATVVPVVPGSYVAKAVKAGVEHAPDVGKAVSKSSNGSTQADFIVSANGTAVHASQSELKKSLTDAGATFLRKTDQSKESGEIYRINTAHGLTDIRIMEGGKHHGPRTVFSVADNDRMYVNPNGEKFKKTESRNERQHHGHIHGQRP